MKPPSTRLYPDISHILARKAEGRRELAARSFAEKIDILEAMRERVAPFRKAREARKGGKRGRRMPEARDRPGCIHAAPIVEIT